MINWLRSWLFMLVFYLGSVPIVMATPITALIGQHAFIANVHLWSRFHRWVLHVTLGITTRYVGQVADGPVFYAAKHHAMLETLELCRALGNPVFVIKRELASIPIWGWAVQHYGAIVVDRDSNAAALRQMMREAKQALAHGRSVIIFPEGTRVAQGETPPLKSGFAGLYRVLGLPVIPIATDSGAVWPKKGPKRAGVVTFLFGKRIPPKLSREEIEARVHAAINVLE